MNFVDGNIFDATDPQRLIVGEISEMFERKKAKSSLRRLALGFVKVKSDLTVAVLLLDLEILILF